MSLRVQANPSSDVQSSPDLVSRRLFDHLLLLSLSLCSSHADFLASPHICQSWSKFVFFPQIKQFSISWVSMIQLNFNTIYLEMGFPGGSEGKEFTCNAGDLDLILGHEDPLEKGIAGYPLQYSCLENLMNRGAWRATELQRANN